ncbi:MAG TPA: tetratricopeptide repeat protein [Bryobacteraceae bacterium]|nr:tetratricopeptide repeat protein [Bryobacteraceae bacterium]
MLVALAASLVEHAATLPDQESAGKERLRARGLLDRAWKLGDTSGLAMNLSQLLKQLPETGTIKYADDPQADEAMRQGEAAFSRRQYDEARRDYARALDLEPTNYSAALFIGNTYDREDAFSKSAEWYDRAIQLAPNVETAYRYYGDILARRGDMAGARTMLIHAAVAEPYNRMVWRELHAWAALNRTRITQVFISVPVEREGESSVVWQPYRDVKARWQTGSEFQEHFPEESRYRTSLPEEVEALTAVADAFLNSDRAQAVRSDPSLTLLLRLRQAGLVPPYVLFSLGGPDIARDYDAFRAQNREKLQEYLDKFVVPPLNGGGLR